MIFNVGDRIKAIAGVCPGHYGIVDSVDKADPTNPENTTYNVTYDVGRKDTIWGRMLVIVERGDGYDIVDGYDIDEG